MGNADVNKLAEELLEEAVQTTETRQRQSTALPEVEVIADKNKYQKMRSQLEFLQSSLKEYLQREYRKKEEQERQRKVVTEQPAQSVSNLVRSVLKLPLKTVKVEKTLLEKVEADVPLNEGTPQDLYNMIEQSATKIEELAKETGVTISNIDKATSVMRKLEKDYVAMLVEEKTGFDTKYKLLGKYESVLANLVKKLEAMKITETGFAKTLNNKEDLENLVIKTKYQLKEHDTNVALSINQKNALTVYRKCLDIPKYLAEQIVSYMRNFCTMVRQLNVSTRNVHEVCEDMAQSLESGQQLVGLMQVSRRYLGGLLNTAQVFYENPPTDIVDIRPFEEQISQTMKSIDSEVQKAFTKQKQLDSKAIAYKLVQNG
ncbi:MAG: hypothetical protein V1837_04865 [Candidatus Woesearchaeota archaeon]